MKAIASGAEVARWQPRIDELPEGWSITQASVHLDDSWAHGEHWRAYVILAHRSRYAPMDFQHEVEVQICEHSRDFDDRLRAFLIAVEALGWPSRSVVDLIGHRSW